MTQTTLASSEGKTVPAVAFRIRRNGVWASVTSDDVFEGKNVAVFAAGQSARSAVARPCRRCSSTVR